MNDFILGLLTGLFFGGIAGATLAIIALAAVIVGKSLDGR